MGGHKAQFSSPYCLIHKCCHLIPMYLTIHILMCLNSQAPEYISDLLTADKPSRTLRSSDFGLLTVPMIRGKSGGGAFWNYEPTLWNKRTNCIKCTTTVPSFKSKLYACHVRPMAGQCLNLSVSLHLSRSLWVCVGGHAYVCGWAGDEYFMKNSL